MSSLIFRRDITNLILMSSWPFVSLSFLIFFFTLCLNRKQSMSLHVQDKVSNGEISVIRAQNKITMMIRNS